MMNLLPFAIATIVSALVFYTIGVWSERFAGRLKTWHLVLFWIGFVFDTTGTTLMGKIAGGWTLDVHAVTGVLAIVLMLGHAVWASIVLLTRNETAIRKFHKFSTLVWLIWLVPFITGLIGAMLP
jgi:uncharacterized repeat protein (TIGR03987 family)